LAHLRWIAFAVLIVLLAAALWSYRLIHAAVRDSRAATLSAVLETEVAALQPALSARTRAPAAALGADIDAILRAARIGASGDAFVFDAQARLLTETRHSERLRELGRTPLLRDLDAPADPVNPAAPPLTELARAALAARTAAGARHGVLLDPYRSYLGHEVIGAWRWLPGPDLGVGIELSAREAYAPLHYLNIGIAAALALMLLAWASLFVPRDKLRRFLRGGAERVGPYRLLQKIGEGAISDVYLARHEHMKRPVAVKLLKPLASTDEWTARFKREVELSSRLSHPNTISIFDYGLGPNGALYYAMEYLEGLSLQDLVERYGPVPAPRAAWILRQVCASLAEAHGQGIVHRDIKPQNIMVCDSGGARDVVKVLDFGLVKHLDETDTRDLTGALRILGTPLYMSPERIRDPAAADARADIYAVGAVAYYLLTARRLFETETDHDLTYQILHAAAPRAGQGAKHPVPPALDELIARCLAKDPAARPQDVQAVTAALDAVLAEQPWTREQIEAWWRKHWLPADHPARRIVPE
jgi:serine/threonine-protein kinase